MRRILGQRLNLRAHRPAQKPLLTLQQRQRRIAFCRRHSNWTENDWSRILFSDESSFQLFRGGAQLVRRLPGTCKRYDHHFTVPTIKKQQAVMVWGCFGSRGRGRLHFVPKGTTINAARYIDILEDKLPIAMAALHTTVFQHDNAPCHTARTVQRYLQAKGVEVLDWPANSPDLNPIENLWHILKRRVRAKCPKNMDELKQAIVQAWVLDIKPEYCQKLISSMPRRIKAVLQNRGYSTKY
jgi:transposase